MSKKKGIPILIMLALSLLIGPVALAQDLGPVSFTIVQDFPQVMYAGNRYEAEYLLENVADSGVPVMFNLTVDGPDLGGGEFTVTMALDEDALDVYEARPGEFRSNTIKWLEPGSFDFIVGIKSAPNLKPAEYTMTMELCTLTNITSVAGGETVPVGVEGDFTVDFTPDEGAKIAFIDLVVNPFPDVPPPSGTTPLGRYVHISTDAETFTMTIKFYYTDEEVVDEGIDESILRLYYSDGIEWVRCEETGVNTVENYVWATVTQFTTFAPFTLALPIANAGGPYSGYMDRTITFDGTESEDPDGEIISYSWDFNVSDGIQEDATGPTPTHTYDEVGTYEITLTVTDDDGLIDSDTADVTVTLALPVADAGGPYSGYMDRTITFDGTGSSVLAGEIVSYSWDFNASDGIQEDATGPTPTHTYDEVGTYEITLTVTDDVGLIDSDTTDVTVTIYTPPNEPPLADAGADRTALLGVPASFDGSGSRDRDGTIIVYYWSFGDGTSALGMTTSHTYTAAGKYTVSLTVTDNMGGKGSDSLTVTVEEEATPDVIEDLPPDEAADIIEDMNTTEAADIIEEMNSTAAADVIEEVSTEAAADIVEEMNATAAADVIEEVSTEAAADIVEEMNVTSAADVVEEMNVTSAADIIEEVSIEVAVDIVEEMNVMAAADVVEEMNVIAAAEIIVEVETEKAADIVEEMTEDAAVYVLVEVETSSAATIMESVEEEDAGDLINAAVQTGQTDQFSDIMLEMEENATAGALLASEPESGAEFIETMANKDLTKTAERVEAAVNLRARELEPEAQEELLNKTAIMLEEVSVESLVALFMEIITLPATPSTVATVFEVMDLEKVLEVVEAWIDLEAYEGLATVFDLLTQETLGNIYLGMSSADRTALYPYLSEETIASLPSLALFQVSELTVTPQQVKTGENVTISATVTNIGEEYGEYTAILKVDGVTEETETVTLAVGESTTISFTVSKTFYGVYTVEVDGQIGSFTVVLEPQEPPVADAGGPYTVQVDVSLTFDGTGSSDPDGIIEVYAWDFGDGGTGEGPTPSHVYSSTGTYEVKLTITDNDGLTDSDTTTVTVEEPVTPYVGIPNKSPVAEAGPNQTVYVDQIVEFSGVNSADPDGEIVSYVWDFGDGREASGVNVSHTYLEPGNYTVTLTVRDNRYGEDSDTCTITVRETPPIIIPPLPPILSDLTITPEEIELGDEVTIGLFIENIDSQSFTYNVTMKIGELTLLVDVELEAYESKTVSRTITPDTVGDYNVTVDGLTGSFTVEAPEIPLKPAEFVASDLSITPEEAEILEEIEISFTVTNVGEETGNYKFSLLIEGPFAVESVEMVGILGAGESETATHKLTLEIPGDYTVTVDGLAGSFVVRPPLIPLRPAEFVVSGLEVDPDRVAAGEAVTITVEVENIGEKKGTHTVLLEVDGIVTELAEVTLDGGESTTVTFTITEVAGGHTVRVEDLTGSFTVTAPGISPGYVAGIIIVIIAAAALLYAIWKGKLPSLSPEIDDKIE